MARQDIIDFSIIQRDVWSELKAWPNSCHLNLGGYTRVEGKLDEQLLERALHLLARQNEALRLLPLNNGKQQCLEEVDYKLIVVDVCDTADPELEAKKWQQAWMKRPFTDLTTPPNRFALIKVDAEVQYIVVQCSHLIMDGWSTSLIVQKWADAYSQLWCHSEGNTETQKQSKGYLDFIDDSLAYKSSNKFVKDQMYWQQKLSQLPEPLFEQKYQTGGKQGLANSHFINGQLPRDFLNKVNSYCQHRDITPFHFFTALLFVYLSKSQQAREIVIGVPSLNRSGGKYKTTLGMFVNVLPIYLEIDNEDSFSTIAERVKQTLTQAYRYAKYPIGEQYKRLQVIEKGRERVFDALLSYENFDFVSYYGDAVVTSTKQTFSGETRYPLAVTITDFEKDKDGEMVIEGSEAYFSLPEVHWLQQRLMFIGEQILLNTDSAITELSITPYREREQILDLLIDKPVQHQVLYHQVIQQQAEIYPDDDALVWQQNRISHGQLQQKVNSLALLLSEQGVVRGKVVALKLGRNPLTVIAILAIQRLGAAFLVVDNNIPQQRLDFILNDSDAHLLLLNQGDESLVYDQHCLCLRLQLEQLTPSTAKAKFVENLANDVAYILYTSGTTGKPKGVKVSFKALSHRLEWLVDNWQITNKDVALHITQPHFDPALVELLLPLLRGGSVAFTDLDILPPEQIALYVERYSATLMAFVPLTLTRFLAGSEGRDIASFRVCCCGGEVLPNELIKTFYKLTNASLYNVYGPTEACIFASFWLTQVAHEYSAAPIGKPLEGTFVYVLDQDKQLQPFGVNGEIYIAGQGLGTGYVNPIGADRQRFQPDTVLKAGEMYQTGDQGWLDCRGFLHFSGRTDRQIKLRGYRIELDEIEQAILSLNGVQQAAVKLDEQGQLGAWVVNGTAQSNDQVRRSLSTKLPAYMLPSHFTQIDNLPLTSSGKVDYSALTKQGAEAGSQQPNREMSALEKAVAKCWQDGLKQRDLSLTDNFFELGGDSLSAAIVLAELEHKFNCNLALYHIVNNPTIELLAEFIQGQLIAEELIISLESASSDVSLYIAASGHNDIVRFKSLAKAIAGRCNLHMLQPPQLTENLSIKQLAKLYADKISSNTNDKIYIAGFSVGGLVALETSKQLQLNHSKVEHLFIVDTILFTPPLWFRKLWRFMAGLALKKPAIAKWLFTRKFRTVMGDKGLLMQVDAMADYVLPELDIEASLLKSNSFSYVSPFLSKKWHSVFNTALKEYQIDTHHSGFFEADKVSKLAEIIQQEMQIESRAPVKGHR